MLSCSKIKKTCRYVNFNFRISLNIQNEMKNNIHDFNIYDIPIRNTMSFKSPFFHRQLVSFSAACFRSPPCGWVNGETLELVDKVAVSGLVQNGSENVNDDLNDINYNNDITDINFNHFQHRLHYNQY